MTEPITARQFHESAGVEDWRVVFLWACARFRTGSFAAGVAMVDAIGQLADALDHHPDVDLRYSSVSVRLRTHSVGGLSTRDVTLARQISAAAHDLGATADPASGQVANLAIDALVGAEVQPFWRALLGYREQRREDGPDYLVDPHGQGPSFRFQPTNAPREQRSRVHVDVWVPHDQAESRVAAALAAGGQLVSSENAPAWWVLADAEGNEACLATWLGRD